MANVIIIGAGLTGLSTAYHLEKRGFFDYKIFEKEAIAGGLCRSISQDGFTFDFTGHLLHATDTYFRQFLETIVGLENLNSVIRRSFIYSNDIYTRYPYQVNLYGLPVDIIGACIEGFVNKKNSKKPAKNFYDWVLHNFGEGIAQNFFFPFQKKIFAFDIKKVTPTWMGRFVPQTSLKQIIRGAIKDNEDSSIGYNAQFFYPKVGGIQYWIEKLKFHINNSICTNYTVKNINLKDKEVIFTNGHSESFKILINTMPLDHLINSLQEKSTGNLKHVKNKLICNSVINFNLGIARENISDKHWIYFPEEKFPFYRMGFPHNFANSMVPAGCSSLYGECSFIKKTVAEQQQLVKNALKIAKNLLRLHKSEIITEKILTIAHAYVIYNFWREKNLSTIQQRLLEQNIYSIGRYGGWKYSSMQEAVLDGKNMAETITVLPASKSIYMPNTIVENPQARNTT